VTEPESGPAPPGRTASHRCPGCARHAERRSPRTVLERIGFALLGWRPYRCLECGRRFPPSSRRSHGGGHAAVVAVDITPAPPKWRHTRWVVDTGDIPLSPRQIYVLVLVVCVVLVLLVLVIRAPGPGTGGGVRVVD
jgi:hypothetical protein